MEEMRLQKFIANSGVCSRRKAEEYILAGKVKVNGVETPYASMAEDYTGAAITKDAAKLGKLMATDKNNKTYELLPNVSYDPNFTYERNTDAGTAVLVVKGIGDYAGSTLRVQFQIKAASVADTDKDVKAAEKVVYVEDDAKKAESYAPELTVIGKVMLAAGRAGNIMLFDEILHLFLAPAVYTAFDGNTVLLTEILDQLIRTKESSSVYSSSS